MNTVDSQIEGYVAAVRRALDDLPAEVRDDLVEDLPAHLAEVRREQAGPLEERLGPPEVYAAELRAAAGLDPGADPAAGTVRDRLATVGLLAARWLRRADRKAGPWIGYQKVSDFLRLLRPAWWVARGYIVAAMLFLSRILPMEQFDEVFGWLVVLVCVVVSVRLGPILQRLPRVGRFVAATALALGALVVAANVHIGEGYGQIYRPSGYDERWGQVRDVFPYDKDRKPLDGVTLYDQDGNPLRLGDYRRCVDADGLGDAPAPAYPLCKGPQSPSTRPVPSESPSAPAPASPSTGPSPSVPAASSPPVGPSPTATAVVSPPG